MRCPFCSNIEDKVIDSRPTDDHSAIRRRRECLACKKRFTTYEKLEKLGFFVIKKDGSRQDFDRGKLIRGILKSCEKRPVSRQQIEDLVDSLEQHALNQMRREIPSQELGEAVLSRLQDLDEVAYIRFASVYRDFQDIDSFVDELARIRESGRSRNNTDKGNQDATQDIDC
ncbi:MAG: transcriptional regulator NrdR [Eubacteriales bacterium]|nr:transcriptional regulator NrdR [Eubacteriales bacterium]